MGTLFSAIPRMKRSARIGTFKEERTMDESPLELLASVASSELNARLPLKKRKIEVASVAQIPKSETINSKANKEKPMKKTMEMEKKQQKAKLKPPIRTVPPMAEAMIEKMRGMGREGVQLVIQKQLYQSDINPGNSRLSFPCLKINTKFLSEREETILIQHLPNTRNMRGIEVLVIDPRLQVLNLRLKKWKMKNNYVYNLTGKWNNLVKENKLEAGDTIQLWVFRVEERRRRGLSDLCFALVKLEEGSNGGDVGTVSSTGRYSPNQAT